MFTIKTKIGIDDHVHVQSVAHHILFIAPIAGGQLCDHHPVIGALVLHPLLGLLCCLKEELRLVPRYSVESQPEEEQRRRVTGAAVGWIVRKRRDMSVLRLIIGKRHKRALQSISKLLVASGQKTES